MYEIRCPSCRMRLWLYQGMGRDVPPPRECPGCHVRRPIGRADARAARLAARIAREHRAKIAARERDDDDVFARPPVRPSPSR
jgi:hypothetical protein